MNQKLRIAIGIALFVAGTIGGNALYKWLSDHSEGAVAAQDMVHKHRPDFVLADLRGTQHAAAEWDGKVTILNFWATWCPPCKREIPAFIDLQKQYGSKGVQFIGIAIDTQDQVSAFVDQAGITYPTLIGNDDAVKVSRAFGNRLDALPYTVILDRRGEIIFVRRGELEREVAEQQILSLL